jgi:flagellar M-ring protein FliF
MEPLLKQLRDLAARLRGLPAGVRWAMGLGGAALAAAFAVATVLSDSGSYQYAFTNLTPEDGSEAAAALKAANIPFRFEGGGNALAVPAGRVHEARLLLAAAGLPRGGGVGFELFDRGDLGVSDFTQRVNLRRATEGELARTIGHLAAVRSARVHLTLPERSLYREEDRKAAAAVVLNLQPGRVMQERELAGIRHLVASAVSNLDPASVTIVDGRGTVLTGDQSESAKLTSQERELETALEQRIVELLEPAVGRGAVVAKVTAIVDSSQIDTTVDKYNPDTTAVRSSRKVTELIVQDGTNGAGVTGAAANQPLAPTGGAGGGSSRAQTSREDEVKNYEVDKTVTRTVSRAPRLVRLSAAVLVDAGAGKRSAADLKRLGELARRAVGFDEARGDRLELSSEPFTKTPEAPVAAAPLWARPEVLRLGGAALVVLLVLAFVGARLFGRRPAAATAAEVALLKPGARVGDVQAALAAEAKKDAPPLPPMPDAEAIVRDRARQLTQANPSRAAHLLRAWVASDQETEEARRG